MADLNYLLSGDPAEKVKWQGHTTMYGGTVYGGRRTIAHLEATNQASLKKFGSPVVVIQSAYNTTVEASAGTHDKDGCLDVYIPGVDWWEQQRFLRSQGWAAWYRYPPTFGAHIHMISLGCPGPLGYLVPGQISDYREHKSGLSGHAADDTWHPADIDATIFDYAAWKAAQEDDVAYSKWPEKDQKEMVSDIADELVEKVAKAVVAQLLETDLYPRLKNIDQSVQAALKGKAPVKTDG